MRKLGWFMTACLVCFLASVLVFWVGAVSLAWAFFRHFPLVPVWPVMITVGGGVGASLSMGLGMITQARIERGLRQK